MVYSAVWLISGVALASVPSAGRCSDPLPTECRSDDARAFFEGGQEKGEWWWDQVICPNAPDCCGEELANVIAQIIALQQPADPLAACEFGGFVERLAARHMAVCGEQLACCESGRSVARMYGGGYCTLAIHMPALTHPLGFLQPMTTACEASFTECCATAFSETTYYFPDGIEGENNDACRPFIEPEPWQPIYQEAQVAVCQGDGGSPESSAGSEPSHPAPGQ